MKFIEATDFIEECNKAGIVPGLDSIRELCKRLGNPQDKLKFIHIAGTNGKGSVLAYISSILKTAGYKTGRYISPTIETYLERFQVNERAISKEMFGKLTEKVAIICKEMVEDGLCHPTAFEVETAIGFLFFLEKKCDIVVLECGMGGLEDATNVISTSVMEVFAHIAMDHMQFLGDSVEKIAANKAGIIKEDTKVVSTIQEEAVERVLSNRCKELGITFDILREEEISRVKYSLQGQSFLLDGEMYKTPLLGKHQIENAALAIKAIKLFKETKAYDGKKPVSEDKIKAGLLNTVWVGRFQIISKKPLFVIDGAHNPDGARRLRQSVDIYFKDKKKVYIVGMFRDKEVNEILSTMIEPDDVVLTISPPQNPRSLSSVELAGAVKEFTPNVSSLDSVEEAVEMAKLFADKDTLILAFGSLSYLGRILNKMRKE